MSIRTVANASTSGTAANIIMGPVAGVWGEGRERSWRLAHFMAE